jgi:hypothetical protein
MFFWRKMCDYDFFFSLRFATARVKLPHHGLHGADEETGERFAFKLTRRAKVTLYLKVGRK